MKIKKTNSKYLWLLAWALIKVAGAFEFVNPTITPDILTINTPATYTFLIMRNFDNNLQ